MSKRFSLRRSAIWLAATAFLVLAAPAAALADSVTITPSDLQAGGSPSVTDTLTFAGGTKTPTQVTIDLPQGLLLNETANTGCLVFLQLTPACLVGTVTVQATGGPYSGNVYLVPPQHSGDVAGFQLEAAPVHQYVGVSFPAARNGAAALSATLSNTAPAFVVSGFSISLNATLNSQPLNRLPTYCSAASYSMSVTYSDASAGTGSGSFTPTGCSSLSYNPQYSVSAQKDASDDGVAITTATTHAAGEASDGTVVLGLPTTLIGPNPASIPLICGKPNATYSNCHQFGTVSATSNLVPIPFGGKVYLTGGALFGSFLVIRFDPPFNVQLTGAINAFAGKTTFNNFPDVPLTNLTVHLTGGPNAAFATACSVKSGTATADFTSQNGDKHVHRSQILTVKGCPSGPPPQGKPGVSGSLSGLGKGQPKLKVTTVHGKNAPNISAVSIVPPGGGLSFNKHAFVARKHCTGKGKKRKCTTTIIYRGLGISGGSLKSAVVSGGKLVISLRKPTGKLGITTVGPLLLESKALQKKVQKKQVKTLTFSVTVKDARGKSTTIGLKLKVS